MQTLPVNETCSSGVGGQQPDHKSYLQLIVERKPGNVDEQRDHPNTEERALSIAADCNWSNRCDVSLKQVQLQQTQQQQQS